MWQHMKSLLLEGYVCTTLPSFSPLIYGEDISANTLLQAKLPLQLYPASSLQVLCAALPP